MKNLRPSTVLVLVALVLMSTRGEPARCFGR